MSEQRIGGCGARRHWLQEEMKALCQEFEIGSLRDVVVERYRARTTPAAGVASTRRRRRYSPKETARGDPTAADGTAAATHREWGARKLVLRWNGRARLHRASRRICSTTAEGPDRSGRASPCGNASYFERASPNQLADGFKGMPESTQRMSALNVAGGRSQHYLVVSV